MPARCPSTPDTSVVLHVMIDLFGQVMEDQSCSSPYVTAEPAANQSPRAGRRSGPRRPVRSSALPEDGVQRERNLGVAARQPTSCTVLAGQTGCGCLSAGRIKLDTSPLRALTLLSSLSCLVPQLESLYPTSCATTSWL